MTNLINALKTLGITGNIKVVTRFNQSIVKVNNRYFGIYDHSKNTFVD